MDTNTEDNISMTQVYIDNKKKATDNKKKETGAKLDKIKK